MKGVAREAGEGGRGCPGPFRLAFAGADVSATDYYGLPLAALTDGQLLAFTAARRVHQRLSAARSGAPGGG